MTSIQPEGERGGVATVEVPPLVLASRSPRRVQLLEMLGLEFEVVPAEVDESAHPSAAPAEVAEHLAREKACAVARLRPDALVIGCDTLVVVDGEVLGKPANEAEAVRMNFLTHAGDYSVAAAARLFFAVVFFLAPAVAVFGRLAAPRARVFAPPPASPAGATTFDGRSATWTVRCAVRLRIRNARPIGAGRIRFCDGPWLA